MKAYKSCLSRSIAAQWLPAKYWSERDNTIYADLTQMVQTKNETAFIPNHLESADTIFSEPSIAVFLYILRMHVSIGQDK